MVTGYRWIFMSSVAAKELEQVRTANHGYKTYKSSWRFALRLDCGNALIDGVQFGLQGLTSIPEGFFLQFRMEGLGQKRMTAEILAARAAGGKRPAQPPLAVGCRATPSAALAAHAHS
jgi:hypothetical protein